MIEVSLSVYQNWVHKEMCLLSLVENFTRLDGGRNFYVFISYVNFVKKTAVSYMSYSKIYSYWVKTGKKKGHNKTCTVVLF